MNWIEFQALWLKRGFVVVGNPFKFYVLKVLK